MTVNNKSKMLLLLLFGFTACRTVSPSIECVLDVEANSLVGNAMSAKQYKVRQRYIPASIEMLTKGIELKYIGKSVDAMHFSENAPEKFCGYAIIGCRDTTWAKITMAEHLMKKYGVTRYDSTYLDTVYRFNVVDEDKLVMVDDSCTMFMSNGDIIGGIRHKLYKCFKWGTIANFSLPPEYHDDTNSVEFENREGKYAIAVPKGIAAVYGLQYYSDNFLSIYGVELVFERVDTVRLGVYRYDLQE